MSGLMDLASKDDVETIFSFILRKITVDDLLNAFQETFKLLYDVKDYEGGWHSDAINAAIDNYKNKTDAIKADYRDKKITRLTGSSVTVVGGILSFTPLAPIGWGMVALGSATNTVTEVVDLADRSKQNAWNSAKDALKGFIEDPYQGTEFQTVYQSLMTSFAKIREHVATDDYSILLQGLGWNYFVFRKHGKSHEEAVQELKTTLNLFRIHRYTISTDLKSGKPDAINDIQNTIKASFSSLLSTAGALAMMGLAAGVSFSAITLGIGIASATFRFAETIARGLLAIGNVASKTLDIMFKFGPAIAAVGGVVSIVFDSIALDHIDETFKPYYDFMDNCRKLLKQYEDEYSKNNGMIAEMIKFINIEIDLVVEDIILDPSKPGKPGTIAFWAKIANLGKADAVDFNIRWELTAPDPCLPKQQEQICPKLIAGTHISTTPIEFECQQSGTYIVKCTADPDGEIPDCSRDNQTIVKKFDVPSFNISMIKVEML